MNQPSTLLTKQSAPPPPIEFEVVGLTDALEIAIALLQDKAELYIIAAKMTVAMGEEAPPEAKKDTTRRRRLLSAIEVLRQHKASLRPY